MGLGLTFELRVGLGFQPYVSLSPARSLPAPPQPSSLPLALPSARARRYARDADWRAGARRAPADMQELGALLKNGSEAEQKDALQWFRKYTYTPASRNRWLVD